MAKPQTKKPGTSVAVWDQKLAERAAKAKKTEASVATGSFISMKGGILSFMGNAVPDNKLRVVVVDAIMENDLFVGKFDPNSPQSPVCYAFGRDEDEMAPHEAVASPECDRCQGCPHNEWGSADTGKGKACKNVRRLALITEDALDGGVEGIADAEVAYLKLPVTSVKAWAGFVSQLAATNKPPLAFVTELSVVPDATSQFKVQFKAVEEIDDGDLLGALLEKADVVEQQIIFPYQVIEAPAKPAARGAARPAAKPAARPVAKPAARSAAKPAARPAPAPAARPAAKSARAAAAPAAAPGRRKF